MGDQPREDLVLAPGARRAPTELLPQAAAFAPWEFINGPLRDAPRRVGAPLRAPFLGLWRARRGQYRVRYEINDQQRLVRVLDIDHRRDAHHGRGVRATPTHHRDASLSQVARGRCLARRTSPGS